jgi:hypothetical protein
MPPKPWPYVPITPENFRQPPREYGILPFWFLNGELDPDEMHYQLAELRDKGMPGVILHARFGLEMPYIGRKYLDRIQFAVEEAQKLGLQTWIYDEMNWPSGTADKNVLRERPDLAQRYIECLNFTVRGPWFTYLTGGDSRYIDFERSRPLAAFAVSSEGQVIDLTPNLSFENVIPWEAPPGNWRLMNIVEKEADYYIDALNPEATAEFLRVGYEPYAKAVGDNLSTQMLGFYTDEPAMHYYVTGGENPIVPWTKDMLRRFQERNSYNLRTRLPDLFFDISPDSARIRYDFYNTLTDFYSAAYYQQIHEWCQEHDVLFTGHVLYEEWLRMLIRVEGNLFKHYRHLDVTGVDHLYPIIGNRDRPAEHVAIKVASSAAHQLGSPRLLCESFGGIFMDATMQRMKWITDWEYVLGVNLLNPHGFHYTLEGPRKRDWPPSMFYQYPWWHYYGAFSEYVSRLSHLLSGGRHVAKVALLWPLNSLFANYTPQAGNALSDRHVNDFNTLTDLLLRLHYDYDFLDEDTLIASALSGGALQVRDESYELIILPPMTHLKLQTLERLEAFVANGGRVLGTVFLPNCAFGGDKLIDVAERIETLFGVNPTQTQRAFREQIGLDVVEREHGAGKTAFLRSYALARQLPMRLQQQIGVVGRTEHPAFMVGSAEDGTRYSFNSAGGQPEDITDEVNAERQLVAEAVERVLRRLLKPDVMIDNPEIFYLHRVSDNRDLYFLVNPTSTSQCATVTLSQTCQPVLWDPSTGLQRMIAPVQVQGDQTTFNVELPAIGSVFVLAEPVAARQITETNIVIDSISDREITGYGQADRGYLVLSGSGSRKTQLEASANAGMEPLVLDGEWEFQPLNANALVIGRWLVTDEQEKDEVRYAGVDANTAGWVSMVPGAWSYQLAAEPSREYPIPVWYRIPFRADYVPPQIDLIVDGFAGSDWKLFINGEAATAKPVRSTIDSQMKSVDITPHVWQGENEIALRLMVTNPTDGLLDLLKLLGNFSVEKGNNGEDVIKAPRTSLQPTFWTIQGYPFFSGRAAYSRRFTLPSGFSDQRVFIEPAMQDDVLEVRVNGQSAGIRLWTPYSVEITELLKPGENHIELIVANTLVNLLEATARVSGIAGAPKLVPYRRFVFSLENTAQ